MMKHTHLEHRFIAQFPDQLLAGVLYVSIEYATAAHCCCCGCGEEVITPFTPTDWKVTFDGETISLYPSIGNWNFACRSHYFIQHGRVIEAATWTETQVADNRSQDKIAKAQYYSALGSIKVSKSVSDDATPPRMTQNRFRYYLKKAKSLWRQLRGKLDR